MGQSGRTISVRFKREINNRTPLFDGIRTPGVGKFPSFPLKSAALPDGGKTVRDHFDDVYTRPFRKGQQIVFSYRTGGLKFSALGLLQKLIITFFSPVNNEASFVNVQYINNFN